MERQWYLEAKSADGTRVDFAIGALPYRIGRGEENDLVIADASLSRAHAELSRDISGRIRLIDRNSTNGTFVNRQRIEGYCLLAENDVIHFAGSEFKLRRRLPPPSPQHAAAESFGELYTQIMPGNLALSAHFANNEAEFDELILGRGLSGAAQPIVEAGSRRIVGYELLGRASHPRLPQTPIELFCLAEAIDRELDLSRAFLEFGVSQIAPRLDAPLLFINAHPRETHSELFLASLERIRHASPQLRLVVEINESAVTNTAQLRRLAAQLSALDIAFAFDDFGAGQARLLELADVPAHYVKFDMTLIRNLHKASARKQQLLRDLVGMVRAAGSIPLAEGVEHEDEARSCIDMGFLLLQGYLTGRPIDAAAL